MNDLWRDGDTCHWFTSEIPVCDICGRETERYEVMRRDGFQCVLCGNSGKDARLEIDHKIPVSRGGSERINNLQTLCFKCNRGKRDKV